MFLSKGSLVALEKRVEGEYQEIQLYPTQAQHKNIKHFVAALHES